MKIHEILTKARELITDEKNWCQGVLARNSKGDHCNENSSEAASWCAVGSIMHTQYQERQNFNSWWFKGPISSLQESSYKLYGARNFATINDSEGGHQKILAIYDDAIAFCKKEDI